MYIVYFLEREFGLDSWTIVHSQAYGPLGDLHLYTIQLRFFVSKVRLDISGAPTTSKCKRFQCLVS